MRWSPPAPPAAPTRWVGPSLRVPLPVAVLVKVSICVGLVMGVVYNLIGFPPLNRDFGNIYHIDLDVYRIGGSAFVHGVNLYGSLPATAIGKPLPFTYPPLAAIAFGPMSAFSLDTASTIMSVMTMVLLAVSVFVALRALVSMKFSTTLWSTAAVSAAAFAIEPVWSTFDYGQINVVLMCLVLLDVLTRRTPWPRGTLIGLVAAIKLTPAVFVLYFLLRRDYRAAIATGLSFLAFTALAFVVTWSDSVQYWTEVIVDSDRIGGPAYISNQSITGMLARLGMSDFSRTVVWLLLSSVVLAIAVVAIRRALAAGEILLALCVNAVLGLLISPVSWSHHWVWAVPLMLALGYTAAKRRSVTMGAVVIIGLALMHWPAHWRLGNGRWNGLGWPLWDQIQASSYVWWGVATIVAVAFLPRWGSKRSPSASAEPETAAV